MSTYTHTHISHSLHCKWETTKWQFRQRRKTRYNTALCSYHSDITTTFREQLTLVISAHHLFCFLQQTSALTLFTKDVAQKSEKKKALFTTVLFLPLTAEREAIFRSSHLRQIVQRQKRCHLGHQGHCQTHQVQDSWSAVGSRQKEMKAQN